MIHKSKVCILYAFIFSLSTGFVSAQSYPKNPNITDNNGKRQGKWTILFDANFVPIESNSEDYVYYRVINYKNDKPDGVVKDFYKDGTVQFEGNLLADRPEEVLDGECILYAENGKKVMQYTFKNNRLVNKVYFDKQGNPTQEHFEVYAAKGDELYEARKYEEAFKWYSKARENAAELCGKNSHFYAERCDDYAFCMSKIEKDRKKVFDAHLEPVKIYENLGLQKTENYAKSCYNLGYMYTENEDEKNAEKYYSIARDILEQLKKTDTETYLNALDELAEIYHKQSKYDKAEVYCNIVLKAKKKAKETDTRSYADCLYRYAFYQKRKGNYAEAEKMMKEVINISAKLIQKRYNINVKPNVIQGIEKIKKINVGPNINTQYNEIRPFISADGKTLYFDRKRSPENTGGENDPDEVYFSILQTDQTWGKAQNIGKPINTPEPNSVISITPDNNMLLLAGIYNEDGSKIISGGISYSLRTEKGWEVPKKMEIKNFVNKSRFVHYSLSADGKTLICSIETDNTFGKRDLFVSFLQENNTWSEPKNLGKQVNTPEDDSDAFLAPDGVTLFYSTAGLPGYGGKDIFVTKRLDDTWTNWSEPQNLGHEINTEGVDGFFVIPASGKYAYMATDFEGTNGSIDIIQLELPDVLKPKPVTLVRGKVIDNKTQKPVAAQITYRDLKTDAVLGIANSSPLDGSYQIVLPAGNTYSFLAEKNGYIPTASNINLEKLSTYKEIEQNLLLTPIEIGQTVRLNNIFFDTDKYELKSESFAELNRLIKILNKNSTMSIEISGHTDATGNEQYNLELSQKRADAVKNYLISKGIPADRLTSKGYGKSKPVADNNTEEGRQQNRRVELTILK